MNEKYIESTKVLVYCLKVRSTKEKHKITNNEKLTKRKITLEQIKKLQSNKNIILFLSLDDLKNYLSYQAKSHTDRLSSTYPDSVEIFSKAYEELLIQIEKLELSYDKFQFYIENLKYTIINIKDYKSLFNNIAISEIN